MSLLELKDNSARSQGEIRPGDDYAKGSGSMLWAVVAAFVVLTVAIVIFVMSIRQKPLTAGEVTEVWTHEAHTINTPLDANGVPTPGQVYDQVLVLAHVHIRNQSSEPIILGEMTTNVTLDDGPRSSYVATSTDYDRIFIAYPALASLRGNKITRDTIIQPGQTIDGMIVSAFHVSKPMWDTHKDLSFTFDYKMHPSLTLTPTVPVIEK